MKDTWATSRMYCSGHEQHGNPLINSILEYDNCLYNCFEVFRNRNTEGNIFGVRVHGKENRSKEGKKDKTGIDKRAVERELWNSWQLGEKLISNDLK